MTGFGAAEGALAGGRLRLEVRTVNHRHLNVQLKLPAELAPLESDIRGRLRSHFERGHATVSAWWAEAPQLAAVIVDRDRARGVVAALREVGRELGIPGDVDLATVARIPDLVRLVQAETVAEPGAVLALLDRAAAACVAMREREGQALAADLRARSARVASLARTIAERAPARLVAERDRLQRQVTELAGGVAVDANRLAQEIAFLADRMDVTEELVRLDTHVAAIESALGDGRAAVGKQLGFLLQELGREANTIGSKANDAVIAEAVVAIKGELERMREQVENLE
jgi:uncharacterized protein (TIGR00255 family)